MASLAKTMTGALGPMAMGQDDSGRRSPIVLGALPAILPDTKRKPRPATETIAGGDTAGYSR
jgi:hypothetical protein